MRRSVPPDLGHFICLGFIVLLGLGMGAHLAHTLTLQAELAESRAALKEAQELAAFHKSTSDYYGRELDACVFRRK